MHGHSTRSIPSPSPAPTDSNPTQQFDDISDFFNNDDVLQSTQHRLEDYTTNTLPQQQLPYIRSTAKKQGQWRMLPSERPIPDTSMVAKEFQDFDQSMSEQEDISIEQGRGHRSNRSTPAKANSTFDFNSIYDMTPPSTRARKPNLGQSGSLRRDAALRRASRSEFDHNASPRPASTRNLPAVPAKQKRTSLAQSHAKVSEDESSLMEQRPPTVSLQAKSTRWGGPRSREHSLNLDGAGDTARSRPNTAQTGTAQSFMLPDIPNLTELVSGVFQDGTPVFSKNTPARSRFTAPNKKGPGRRQPNYIPVDSVPIPEEEKAIIASLQLLQERVAQLETERAEAVKKVEEQELEIIELKAGNRRSGNGSGADNDAGKSALKVEKMRLETSVQTLQKKLERSERKLSISEIEKNRLQKERDSMATQLTVAFQNFDELKAEKEALTAENGTLRQEVDSLRAENDDLRDQLDREQQNYREETLQLRHQLDRTDNGTQRETASLRAELSRVRAQNDENTQRLARKEAELRKAKQEQAEFARLQAENDLIREQLAELKAKREQELRRWANREYELKDRIGRRDETIRHFQDMTQEQTNEAMRMDNENLRQELAQLSGQYEDEASRWAKREEQLRRKVDAAQEKEGLTREILSLRQANEQLLSRKENTTRETTTLQRRPSQRREDTRTRIANRVHEEARNARPASSSYIEKDARKSFSKASVAQRDTGSVSRSASAPIYNVHRTEVNSDVESTTDLSLAPRNPTYSMHGANGTPSAPSVEKPAPLDLTELSYIDAEQIAQLRRALEEERAGLHARRTSESRERTTREDTARSAVSAKSTTRQQSLPRKSSMKDITERTKTGAFDDATGGASQRDAEPTQTGQTDVDASILSNTSRRRRSAPADNMTSAFILPDLKLTSSSRRNSTVKLDITEKVNNRSHDNDNCTVCRREATNPPTSTLQVPKLVPVSARMPDNEPDATMRPSVAPREALALVVKELCDERAHLHLELAAARAMLEAHDVSMGMKKRTSINEVIKDVLRLIEVKDTQIYHLYDVLEGQTNRDITEADVEELTREIRMEDGRDGTTDVGKKADGKDKEKERKKGKKVTVQSFHESEDELDGLGRFSGDEGELESELPWEGFEDSRSLRLDGRRGSVY